MCFVTSVKCFFCQWKCSITHSLRDKSANTHFPTASKVESAPYHHTKKIVDVVVVHCDLILGIRKIN
jgi:hypothetical protein